MGSNFEEIFTIKGLFIDSTLKKLEQLLSFKLVQNIWGRVSKNIKISEIDIQALRKHKINAIEAFIDFFEKSGYIVPEFLD